MGHKLYLSCTHMFCRCCCTCGPELETKSKIWLFSKTGQVYISFQTSFLALSGAQASSLNWKKADRIWLSLSCNRAMFGHWEGRLFCLMPLQNTVCEINREFLLVRACVTPSSVSTRRRDVHVLTNFKAMVFTLGLTCHVRVTSKNCFPGIKM